MDFQTIIVGLIVFGALFYVASKMRGKVKSFSAPAKSASCGGDCGCGK